MPRMARIVVPGIPHHITQRGNRKLDIFFGDADCQKFLQLVFQYSRQCVLDILAYCLMLNHVHFICIPSLKSTLASAFGPVNTRYSQYYNQQNSTIGRLWQGRYFSCPMDEPHLWSAMRYVERNPVRAGIVSRPEDYPWSSASAHCGLRNDPLLSAIPEPIRVATANWSNWLADPEDEIMLKEIRSHTRTGRPFGDKNFIEDLESRLGRRVHAWHRGRPKKQK
jgi:putative transposase